MRVRKIYWWLMLLIESMLWGHIGRFCYIAKPSFISRKRQIFLGDKVRIYHCSRLEPGEHGRILFGDNISIGPNINVTAFNAVSIGSGTTISANVFITDMDHDIHSCEGSVMESPNIVKTTVIEDNCFIGANVVILAGSHLKSGCVVGANSTVRGVFESNSIILGSPAKLKGLRR